MGRAGRSFEEGRIYHIYNRVAGGWRAFSDDELADRFVHLFRLVVSRDEVVVFGWSLLENHFHLILKQGPVSLSRSLKTLQQGVTRSRNLCDRTFGSLWQGRFKAKEVSDQKKRCQAPLGFRLWGTRHPSSQLEAATTLGPLASPPLRPSITPV